MKILSLGAGVQSTTLYLMSNAGEVERADYAIFADTGWEPKEVYEHLERLEALQGIPILRVSAGNILEDVMSSLKTDGKRFASIPLFTKDEMGKVSMLRRQCTKEYKLYPLRRQMRELGAHFKDPFEVWIGISVDEAHRMKPATVKYTRNRWPLIELGMSRHDCRQYLESQGWVQVPKSACIGCPFHDDASWQWLKSRPEEWAQAVDFDKHVRHLPRLRDETFLHRQAVPLDEVVFDGDGQYDLFGNECEGMCGV